MRAIHKANNTIFEVVKYVDSDDSKDVIALAGEKIRPMLEFTPPNTWFVYHKTSGLMILHDGMFHEHFELSMDEPNYTWRIFKVNPNETVPTLIFHAQIIGKKYRTYDTLMKKIINSKGYNMYENYLCIRNDGYMHSHNAISNLME